MSGETSAEVAIANRGKFSGRTAGLAKGKPFQKGVSGNPSGRPARKYDVEKLAKEQTPAAIKALVTALKYPRERVSAAIALLDRGWGKPQQQILGDAEHPVAIAFSWAPAQQPNTVDTASNTPTIDANDAALKIVWDRDGTDGE